MPKRIKHRRPTDVSQAAHSWVEASTSEAKPAQRRKASIPAELSEYMSKIGRKGGKKGGKRRLDTMTAEERSEIAMNAARARWGKPEGKS